MVLNADDIQYTAFFVDDPEKLLDAFAPKHTCVYAHHSTNWYQPKNLDQCELGNKTVLRIIGRAFDDKGDALLVENIKSKNKYPHVTLSCAEGTSPVYSNELLERASKNGFLKMFKEIYVVEVTEGYADYNGRICLEQSIEFESR